MAKGGLFLFDAESGAYGPAALSGFDETSSRRLRLPRELLEGYAEDEARALSGENLSPYKMYFSNREFRVLAALRIFPIALGQGAKAYLLCADVDQAIGPIAPMNWRGLAEKAAEGLIDYTSRFRTSPSPGIDGPSTEKALDSFAAALETARNRGLKTLFLVAPLAPLVETLRSKTPQAERERILAESRTALSRMFPIAGSVVPLSGDRVGILLASQAAPDADLILHQVSRCLGRIFLDSERFPVEAERVLDPASADFRLEEFLGPARAGA